MKSYFILLISLFFICFPINAQNWFPLGVGNRWDYVVHYDAGSMGEWYDTISIEITSKQVLSNGLEYYLLSAPFIWWYYPYPQYLREENSKIYFFDVEDSLDCFAYRFDVPLYSFYEDCKGGQQNIYDIDTSDTFGYSDIHQDQNSIINFSYKFGLYHLFLPGIVEMDCTLKGCIISDTTYGQLLVSVKNSTCSPMKIYLSTNYPNPFNPVTKIKFEIPGQARNDNALVTLKVYDLLGREVATLVNEEKPAGEYEVEFNAAKLPSGIYFYQLRAVDPSTGSGQVFVETRKMVLIK